MAISKELSTPTGFTASYVKIVKLALVVHVYKDEASRWDNKAPAIRQCVEFDLRDLPPELAAEIYTLLKGKPDMENAEDLLANPAPTPIEG